MEDMSDYEFDFAFWKTVFPMRFPLKDWYKSNRACVTSPADAVVVEALREMVMTTADVGPSVPTDLFVFGKGEPARRDVTKVGGLPYRPRGLPWPRTSTGEAFNFIAQLRFSESRDLVGETPGDLLLVFAPFEEVAPGDEMHFEWYPLGLTDLVREEEIPPRNWSFQNAYGARFRTVDYPDRRAEAAACAVFPDSRVWSPWSLFVYEGTKIGGAPFFLDEEDIRKDLPGKFLGQVGTVSPIWECSYPWLNEPEPLLGDEEDPDDPGALTWGDGGLIYLSLGTEGEIYWSEHSY